MDGIDSRDTDTPRELRTSACSRDIPDPRSPSFLGRRRPLRRCGAGPGTKWAGLAGRRSLGGAIDRWAGFVDDDGRAVSLMSSQCLDCSWCLEFDYGTDDAVEILEVQ